MAVDRAKLSAERSAVALARLQAASQRAETRCDQVRAEVERFAEEYARALDQHRKNLLAQVSQAREQSLRKLEEQRSNLQQQVS